MEEIIITNDFITLTVKDFFIRLVVASGAGLLIGLEREHNAIASNQKVFAGVRTFTIVTLLGFMTGITASAFGFWILYLCLSGLLILVIVSYIITTRQGDIGGTSELTLIASFLLGLLALMGYVQIIFVFTVIILTLLSLKLEMKAIAGKLSREEIFALVRFVTLAGLALPFLPDKTIDPVGILNPREIMLIIILTSGLSFFGYLLTKFLGPKKGIVLTGMIGGFVSSTAVTWVLSKKSKENSSLSVNYAAAILLASSIMPLRVLALTGIFNRLLVPQLIAPMVILAASGIVTGWLLARKTPKKDSEEAVSSKNPLNLADALKFAAIFTAILYLVHFSIEYFGSAGAMAASAIAGITDVDAITISLAKMTDPSIKKAIALNGILLATVSNNLFKMLLCLILGSSELKKFVLIGFGIVLVAGVIGFIILNTI